MAPSTHGAKVAAGTGSSEEMPPRKATTVVRSGAVPPSHRGKGAARSGSTGEILQKKAANASSGGVLPVPVPPQMKKTTAASSGGSQPPTHARKAKTGLRTEKMPWNSSTKVKPDTIRSGGQTTSAKDSEESAAKHRTIKGKAHTVLSEERQHEIAANKALHAKEEEEGRLFIQELNELRQGEYVSFEEFLSYAEKLAPSPPWIDLNVKLEDEELLRRQHCLHALYRFRYYKYKVSKKELRGDKLKEDNPAEEEEKEDGTTSKDEFLQDINEDDCTPEFIEKHGFFNRFEEDGTLDWFFHPDYIYCASLDDYQRLVLRNYGGYEYASWADYHQYLQTYKMEREYLKYYEKLSKDLNWMKNYLHIEYASPKWRIITCRGDYQARKIAATDFTGISSTFAQIGYYEFLDNICTLFSELDDLYFELWQRVSQSMLSFKDALKEVCNLNKFPLHQPLIKRALEFDKTLKFLEQKFNESMDNITSDDKKDKVPQEWIPEAVKKQFDMPKTYEQYIRKKIGIASTIGIPGIEAI